MRHAHALLVGHYPHLLELLQYSPRGAAAGFYCARASPMIASHLLYQRTDCSIYSHQRRRWLLRLLICAGILRVPEG